jgi:hypothetical protein
MHLGKELEKEVYELGHINQVLVEITRTFPGYFEKFKSQNPEALFSSAIKDYEIEQKSYREYMYLLTLEEFEDNPSSFKGHTKTKCPIIRRCLMSNDEVMKQYKFSFAETSGRQLLDGVKKIAWFGSDYVTSFDDETHEKSRSYQDLKLEPLNEQSYGVPGVIGYGVQSSLLYGQYPHAFAHRSQNAVWSLYFITNKKSFGLEDDSEFLMVQPKRNTCEQNYFYPADLFGFYALQLYLLLKVACLGIGIKFYDRLRYIYLSVFTDFITDQHRKDIEVYKWSSEYVEDHWFS